MPENNIPDTNQNQPILSILESLKGAKEYLAETCTYYVQASRSGLKTSASKELFVCFAMENFYLQKYNLSVLESGTPEDTAYSNAQRFIYDKLKELADSHRHKCSHIFFSAVYAETFLPEIATAYGKEEIMNLRQKARHLWLDSLIAELENTTQDK